MIVAMTVVGVLFRHLTAIITKESHEPQPEHVERGNKSSDHHDEPENPASIPTGIDHPQYFVLREKYLQRREPRNRKCGDRHGNERPRHEPTQPAHLAHVLLATDAVDYG